jgi:phage replication O-like protein O
MANIPKPNYTQTPNIFFDEIIKELTFSELKVMLVVMRKTFGWQKKKDKISYSQIQDISGLSRQGVHDGLHGLMQKGYLRSEKTGQLYSYSLIIESDNVNAVDQSGKTTGQRSRPLPVNAVDQLSQKPVYPVDTQKKEYKEIKETIREESKNLSIILYELHLIIDPGYKQPDLDGWAADIDKINRLDGRDWQTIEKVIRWAKSDGFWKSNIISGKKLRDKFSQLYSKMSTVDKPKKHDYDIINF